MYVKIRVNEVSGYIGKQAIAVAAGPLIIVERDYDRPDIIAHEREHVKQWWWGVMFWAIPFAYFWTNPLLGDYGWAFCLFMGLSSFSLCYRIRPLRAHIEAAAYAAQARKTKHPVAAMRGYSAVMARYYRLNITQAEALELIKRYY